MNVRQVVNILMVVFLLIAAPACTDTEDEQQTPVFGQVPEIQEIKPQKPVKIKLKRNTKGEYSWDISGDNVDEIIKADKRLKEGLKNK